MDVLDKLHRRYVQQDEATIFLSDSVSRDTNIQASGAMGALQEVAYHLLGKDCEWKLIDQTKDNK